MQPNIEHDVPTVSPNSLLVAQQTILTVDSSQGPAFPRAALARSLPYFCWSKATDLAFGLCGLLVLLLLMPVLALFIYVDSPGPIFYVQERVGFRGRKFRMYKFRSMRTDAELAGHAIWASMDDARVTRFGRFLRATHLDELPQIFNILHGEMSLIGPRPERPEYSSELGGANPVYYRRLTVKPGLTGWSQVNYGYGSTSKDELEKLEYDLYYIEHRSFRLDLLIIVKTVAEVVLCHGT